MKAVIISKPDIASCNIFDNLMEIGEWKKQGEFWGNPMYFFDDFCIATINDEHIFHENVDLELHGQLKEKLECIIYASRHRSESGKRSLTVHPIGNYNKAEFGGREKTLVPTSPHLMTESLRILRKKAKKLEFSVSFEATHHGPYLQIPTYFIEIGSDESAWHDKEAGRVIAETILETKTTNYPVGIGVGGGHYSPRITDVALERKISFGHIVPTYAVDYFTSDMAEAVIQATRDSENVYFHKKRLKGPQYTKVKDIFQQLGLTPVRTSDLKMLDE